MTRTSLLFFTAVILTGWYAGIAAGIVASILSIVALDFFFVRAVSTGKLDLLDLIDFAAFREIADDVGAYLVVDAAHFIGLVAGGAIPSPVPHADVVCFTTHKVLRGPRGGMILCREALGRLRQELICSRFTPSWPLTRKQPTEPGAVATDDAGGAVRRRTINTQTIRTAFA